MFCQLSQPSDPGGHKAARLGTWVKGKAPNQVSSPGVKGKMPQPGTAVPDNEADARIGSNLDSLPLIGAAPSSVREGNWVQGKDPNHGAPINNLEPIPKPRVKGQEKPQPGMTHPNIMVCQLNEAIEDAVKTSFSLKKVKTPGNRIPKWVRDLMVKKKSLSKQYNTTKCWIRLKEIKEEIKVIDHKLKESYDEVRDRREKKFIPLLQDDPASFYAYANSFARNRSEIGPLIKEDGDSTLDSKTMAQILAKQYNSVYTTPRTEFTAALDGRKSSTLQDQMEPVDHPYYAAASQLFGDDGHDGRDQNPGSISNIEVDFGRVDTAIRALSTRAAPGPDGIPTSIYKYGGTAIIHFLVLIFSTSLDLGLVPGNMKFALISPIFKGGDKGLASSYRPVALTSHLSKILERVIRAQLVEYLEGLGMLDPQQHGSRP